MKKLYVLALAAVFLFVLVLSANAGEISTYGIKLSKEYSLDFSKDKPFQVFTGSISSDSDQLILLCDNGSKKVKSALVSYYRIKVYDIKDKKAKLIWRGPNLNDFEHAFTYGDLNNDNSNALYVFNYDKVDQYKYDGKKMKKQTFKLPVKYYTKQALIGDIDNDGKNELVAFVSDKKDKYALKENLSLIIYKCNLDKKEFNAVYFGTFSYSGEPAPDKLQCIADIYNKKKNKLVIKLGQTDIEPSRYKILSYQNNKLYKEKVFDQMNNISALDIENTAPNPEWFGKITGEIIPLKYSNENYVIAKMLPQVGAPSTTLAVDTFTSKKIINFAQIRLDNPSELISVTPITLTKNSNSSLFYLNRDGKADIYKVDSMEY
ncbi:MAG: hypothetical protein ABIH00_02280 [Armatimonadota bacterium]